MKVLLLADIPGWIVDRIADRMIAGMPAVEFTKRYYACLETGEILRLASDCDLIHYLNWDIERHWPRLLEARKPILMGVRSHRFPPYVHEVAHQVKVHAITRALQAEFPGSVYIPDALMVDRQRLLVGWAGKPCAHKGDELIKQACRETGAEFFPAMDWKPQEMPDFYRFIDVLACASENEGFSTPVMEALAMNLPVISTRCGAPWEARLPGVTWVDRNVESIKAALLAHWPASRMVEYTWAAVCPQFERLYRVLLDRAD